MNPNEQKAADIIKYQAVPAAYDVPAALGRAVKALSAAGLLVTPMHERALAACEEIAGHYSLFPLTSDGSKDSSLGMGVRVGRESLEAKNPKPRYSVEHFNAWHPDEYRVIDHTRGIGDVRGFGTRAECEAIIAALESLNAKEAAR